MCGQRVCGALSRRAKPSRHRKQPDRKSGRRRGEHRPSRITNTRRRNAEVLSSGCRVKELAILFAHRARTTNRVDLIIRPTRAFRIHEGNSTMGCVFRNQAAVVIRIRENWREQGRFGMGGINTPYGHGRDWPRMRREVRFRMPRNRAADH